MQMDVQPKVAIAGAGPVGLALALGLARMGVRTVLLEQAAELPPFSRAVVVLTRTLEAFQGWNVGERFFNESEFLTSFSAYRAETNTPFIRLDFSALKSITPRPGVAILPQDQTEKILCEELLKTGLSEVRFQHEVVSATQDDAGIRLTIQSGDGARYDLEAAYLVGCDGAHSAVRASLGITLEGTTYPAHVFLADVHITDSRDALPWPRLTFDTPRFLFAVRFEPGRWRIVGALGTNPDVTLDHDFYAEQVEATIGSGPFEIMWQSTFKIHRRHAASFRTGRILLAGDAAHLNSPAG
ncbi:MAG: FAD-dependent monooxygenase, partial [Candidatus Eremiobacteraeota bacterium]|nr:FAD-dependent monooxygenase [Candidatus Eremiobacteraeota bacterium]